MVMTPLILHAHRNPITWLKYNREGDLLFVASKDTMVTVWFVENGEILGSFKHSSAVNCLDVNYDSRRLLTATANGEVRLFNVKTGNELLVFSHTPAPIKTVQFAEGDKQFCVVLDKYSKYNSTVLVFDIPAEAMYDEDYQCNDEIIKEYAFELEVSSLVNEGRKITCAAWGPLNKQIIVGCDDGTLASIDVESNMMQLEITPHKGAINKIAFSNDKKLFITASSDNTAKLFETSSFELLKTYQSTEQINTAAISPLKPHVALSGGLAAVHVTTTLKAGSTFDIHFYHTVFENAIGKVKGHFGPVHMVAFSPDGTSFTSGGEDGIVRVNKFDKEYLKLKDGP